MPQYKTLRHLDPKPTIKVFVPNTPKMLEPVRHALRLEKLTMSQLIKRGRRAIKSFLNAKAVDNEQAVVYYGSKFRQISAEHRFRITKKTFSTPDEA